MLQGLGRDFAFAARRLLATPMFTAFAILSLAFGVGVTTAVYSVVDSIFWKETGIRDPETALFITAPDSELLRPAQLSQPDFDDIRASQNLTLLLAMVGLFGIQSHTVTFRTREIGVRMTFGATAGQIKRMVLKDGYIPVLQGLAIGVFIGFIGRALIRSQIRSQMDTDISIIDPWMFLVVPIPLLLAAFCACYWPAHRASRVDPQVALRTL